MPAAQADFRFVLILLFPTSYVNINNCFYIFFYKDSRIHSYIGNRPLFIFKTPAQDAGSTYAARTRTCDGAG